MALTPTQKKNIIEGYRIHEKDTGSPEVQIALITERIKSLTEHFKKFGKDHNSRRIACTGWQQEKIAYLFEGKERRQI